MIYISPADDDDDDGCSATVVQVYIPVQDTKGESGWWVGAGRSRIVDSEQPWLVVIFTTSLLLLYSVNRLFSAIPRPIKKVRSAHANMDKISENHK